MLSANLAQVCTVVLFRNRRRSRLSWVLGWLCPVVIGLLVDMAWPPTLLYALIGVAQRRAPEPSSYASRHMECEIIGNPDFYGLGIRLGIYFQWLSALLAGPSEGEGLLVSYFVFALALYVSFFVFTFGDSATFVAEVAIMLLIFFGGIYIMITSRFYRKRKVPRANATEYGSMGLPIVYNLVLFPMVLYGCWFWCRMAGGRIKPFAESPCGTYLFLFARVTPGRVRMASGFMAFVFIYTLLAVCFYQLSQLIMFLGPLLFVWRNRSNLAASSEPQAANSPRVPSIAGSQDSIPASLLRFVQLGVQFDDADAVLFRQSAIQMVYVLPLTVIFVLVDQGVRLILWTTGQSKKPWVDPLFKAEREDGTRGPLSSMSVALYVFVAIALSILGVELTLVWNSISGVYEIKSPGQLIPLIIGMGTLGQVLWKKLISGFETLVDRLVGQSPGDVNHGAERELDSIARERTVDIEAGASFQLPDSRWMVVSSSLRRTAAEPSPSA
ncbi:uncharacterized protein EI97DRAFT_467079 [Westerdykella ornata]|uniref:Uncharacterized protein n=1 Tax=Westerdykella ornata TaxID=318751 RepID=A0A6A6JJD5_WESOR|nr:uncharacterized protein EI97DRAFT_467079 [Westerdykella ornata]KAF2276374.1 hypothetical protein EI97DRAFT_467079 [Westerdykella ornata]